MGEQHHNAPAHHHHDDEEHDHEGHEGAPEWLISFADNVALMMAFFVILLAMSMNPKGDSHTSKGPTETEQGTPAHDFDMQQAEFVIAMRQAFNNPVNFSSPDPQDLQVVRLLQRRGNPETLDTAPAGDRPEVQSIRPTDYHKLSAAVPFAAQSADLDAAAVTTIGDAASHLRGLRLVLELRGHASAAESAATPDHGMDLSYRRAMAVARALAAAGIDWKQIRIMACGDQDRLRSFAYTPQEQRPNQRVEIILTDELARE
jgi:outer membrane protein OmpA-like peptidoglycan-associated protein